MSAWEVARIDELDRFPVDDEGLLWRPVRRRFGIAAFGSNAYTAERAGQRVVEEHTEATNGHEELYVVATGRATFALDGEEHDAPEGTLIFVGDPFVVRSVTATKPGTTVLTFGTNPGVEFVVSAFEQAMSPPARWSDPGPPRPRR